MRGNRMWARVAVGLALAVVAVVAPQSPAAAAGQGPYWLLNYSSDLCADVANGTVGDNVQLIQYTCNNGGNQYWHW